MKDLSSVEGKEKWRRCERMQERRKKEVEKKLEEREKEEKGRSRIKGDEYRYIGWSFPCPAAFVLRAEGKGGGRERKRAKSGGLASCTRTHTPGSRVLRVARVMCVRDEARENLVQGYIWIYISIVIT